MTRTTDSLGKRRIAIIGAGPTGLGAAYRLAELGYSNFAVFEKNDYAGGLAASFTDDAGFVWDIGGHVQFSHYDYFDRAMDSTMGGDWLLHERESWVWMRERFIPYPFQNNIHFLPEAERRACLLGLIRRRQNGHAPANFEEWIYSRFGEGIATSFMVPYNRKVWAHPLSMLDYGWIGERVADVDLERIITNWLDDTVDASWGPNNRFRFPLRGGTGEIWRRMADALPSGSIEYERDVCAISPTSRTIHFTDGTSERYDILLSTMPLDRLAHVSGDEALQSAASGLRYSTVHVVGIGLRGAPPESLRKKCWIYFPESTVPFFRLTVFSNYSPNNVPDATQQWSVMVEVSESSAAPVCRDGLIESVIEGLVATGVLTRTSDIVSCWQFTAPHGYPTPFLNRDAVVKPMLAALRQSDIYSRGRFGAWKYEVSNQDHAFMQGVEFVDHVAFGTEEITLEHPDTVNAPRG